MAAGKFEGKTAARKVVDLDDLNVDLSTPPDPEVAALPASAHMHHKRAAGRPKTHKEERVQKSVHLAKSMAAKIKRYVAKEYAAGRPTNDSAVVELALSKFFSA